MSRTWMIAKKEKGLSCNLKPHGGDAVPLGVCGVCERVHV